MNGMNLSRKINTRGKADRVVDGVVTGMNGETPEPKGSC